MTRSFVDSSFLKTNSKPAGDSSRKRVWLYLIAANVSLIALGDAIYLTTKDLTGESLRCTIVSGRSEVLSSKYAHIDSFR
jgi:hypothetical protein